MQGTEANADSPITSTADVTTTVEAINNGYELNISTDTDGNVIGSNNADSNKDIDFTVGTVEGDKDTGEVVGNPSDTVEGNFDLNVTVQKPTDGADTITGTDNNDIISGGAGNDTLIGGAGDDTFVWHLGDQGSSSKPAVDVIKDFGLGDTDPNGADKLDLSDLLQETSADSNSLDQYFSVVAGTGENDGKTVVNVSTEGNLSDDGNSGYDQQIILDNVTFDDGTAQIIKNMIAQGLHGTDNNG